jgi:hypothetical protein
VRAGDGERERESMTVGAERLVECGGERGAEAEGFKRERGEKRWGRGPRRTVCATRERGGGEACPVPVACACTACGRSRRRWRRIGAWTALDGTGKGSDCCDRLIATGGTRERGGGGRLCRCSCVLLCDRFGCVVPGDRAVSVSPCWRVALRTPRSCSTVRVLSSSSSR